MTVSVATKIILQHYEVVAIGAIATTEVWLLEGAGAITMHNACGNKDYITTRRSRGNKRNCHT
jgi:hypothetical protein